MRGKTRGFWYGIMILVMSGVVVLPGIVYLPGQQARAVGAPLLLDFPAPIERNIVAVSAVSEVNVVPCGQSIGVLLHAQGVMVVGHAAVEDRSGNNVNPAVDAGISDGDIILKIAGEAVKSEGQVRDIIARAGATGQSITFEVKRGEQIFQANVNPAYCRETQQYRIGLLIKDSAAGLGTLTFYEPGSMTYGALGHIITDNGTQKPIEITDGKIVGASIQSIHRGKRGQPGEKIGSFQDDDREVSGTIFQNTKLGIFGKLQNPPAHSNYSAPIPVSEANHVRKGQAEILTVLKDEQVESFTVEIQKINPQASNNGKGMIIKITDPRLLEQTGGIIQGMSGSPIIQDNKLVGAVTHVFVNDPTRGYAVPAEWMLRESGLLNGTAEGQAA
ncbi:MAG: SpoIVB peptidase precursor [Pelotomaculum sp. PtaB.Bin104]|nr:MAG: SpoIVB peptidase precursor [Pelotomaculum sp. PtaB.Bin104]